MVKFLPLSLKTLNSVTLKNYNITYDRKFNNNTSTLIKIYYIFL